jgi:RHS repeat-associated protein
MAMTSQLSENTHQGFDGIKAGLCLGLMEVKSNTASGMPLCLWRNSIGSRSTGKERDAETGLDYFLARYFSAAQGRFISADAPFADQHSNDPQSWNLYVYVRNNPLSHIDPTGRADLGAIAWGIAKGTGSFIYNNTPIPGAVQATKDLFHPTEAQERFQAQAQAHISLIKSLGSADGWNTLGNDIKSSWNQMSTTDKTSTVTQAVLGIGTAVAGGIALSGEATTTVTHFTNDAGVAAITDTGGLLRGGGTTTGTFVAPAGEIPVGATSSEIEGLLEIGPGKGTNSITFETPNSNLVVPENGVTTSGGVTQYQLNEAIRIDPTKFKKTN